MLKFGNYCLESQFKLLTVASKALVNLAPPNSPNSYEAALPLHDSSHSGLLSTPRRAQDLPTSTLCKC